MKELTEKKRKILLGILKIGKKTNLPKLNKKLKDDGVNTHPNYVRRVAKEFGDENLIETETLDIGQRVFQRIEPKYDEETFKELGKLFLKSPDCAEFLKSNFAQEMLDDEFLETQVKEFKEYLEENDLIEDEIIEWLDILLVNPNIFRKFPIGLYYLMFPSELEKELSIFIEMGEETDEHFDRLANVIVEEITSEQIEQLEKFVDYMEKQHEEMIERFRDRIDWLRQERREKK